jgi:PTH1 family peptidyl-tRNA hydrolase
MKMVVGLGNPGSRYQGTRHNVGFDVIDELAKVPEASKPQRRAGAEVIESFEAGNKVLLIKPQSFMNRSGLPIRGLVDFHKLSLEDLLVICDDINLPLGQLRVRAGGTHGGHNGLRDLQSHLGTTEYARLRIGVGAPEGRHLADYVLDRFHPSEASAIESAIERAAAATRTWIAEGTSACMNKFNARRKDEN